VITTYSVAGVIVYLCFVWNVLYFVPDSCILKCVYCEEVNVKMFEFPIHSSTPRGEVSGVAYVTYSQSRRCIESWRTCDSQLLAVYLLSIVGLQHTAEVLICHLYSVTCV